MQNTTAFQAALRRLSLALALGACMQAHAQAPAPGGPMVITVSYVALSPNASTSKVATIDKTHIDARHARNVAELLQSVPGLYLEQASGRGGVSSVYMRGGDPNFTLVLIDGVAVNNPTNSRGGSYDLSTLNIADIERIEVAQGPMSAIYGSGALSGVINIITRRGHGEGQSGGELSAGEHGYRAARVYTAGGFSGGDYALTASTVDEGEPLEGTRFENSMLSGNFGFELGASTLARVNVRASSGDHANFPDDSGGPEYAVYRLSDEREVDERIAGISLTHDGGSNWRQQINFSWYQSEDSFDSPGVAPGIRNPFGIPANFADNDFTRYTLDWRHDIDLNANTRLILGASGSKEDGETTGGLDLGGFVLPTAFELQRDNWALFAEGHVQISDGLLLQAAARQDFPDEFSSQFIPKLGAVYSLSGGRTVLRANWGKGFKLPSFFALGHPIVGNPTLRPERARSTDLSLTHRFAAKNAETTLTLFHNRFEDLIDLRETPSLLLVNRSEVTTRGAQLELMFAPATDVSARAHLDYVDSDIRDSNEELRNRPEWRAGVALDWRYSESLGVKLDVNYTGSVHDSSIPTGDRDRDAYTRADLAFDWRPAEQWSVFLVIDNLFDADYEDAIGFPAPGINARAGLRLEM